MAPQTRNLDVKISYAGPAAFWPAPVGCGRIGRVSTFILIPGAGGRSWYWHRVAPLLRAAGSDATAVDLPGDDETAGLPEYAALVTAAIGDREDVVLVAASLGAFTAPLVASAIPLRSLVFVNAMIPVPGETAGEWWDHTHVIEARQAAAYVHGYSLEFDLAAYFYHDVPAEVIATGEGQQFGEAAAVFESVCDFASWPDIPIRVVAGEQDRFFPVEFQQRLSRERLGLDADVLPGGHLIALARPEPLAQYLLTAAG
jgi:pimeloyl-ACP methyl ester carboxylesterase